MVSGWLRVPADRLDVDNLDVLQPEQPRQVRRDTNRHAGPRPVAENEVGVDAPNLGFKVAKKRTGCSGC